MINPEQKPITLQQAAGMAGVSPDTVARWCKRYGIGKQLHPKAPWRVDPVGVAIVAAGDAKALADYLAAARQAPSISLGAIPSQDSPNRHDLQGEL